MYSLYRAWLSLGPPCAVVPPLPSPPQPPLPISQPPLNLSTPERQTILNGAPDVVLQVGPGMTQFSAHRAVLSVHSGFFKAALISQNTDQTPIAVPNVNVDEFSSLLTFMYTGYLDLNLSNIYNILLATHILHMPRALEICRSFLLHSQSAATSSSTSTIEPQSAPRHSATSIIKPIASRKTVLPTQQQQFYAPAFSNLHKSDNTPFKTVVNNNNSVQSSSTPISLVDNNKIVAEKNSTSVIGNQEHQQQASTSKLDTNQTGRNRSGMLTQNHATTSERKSDRSVSKPKKRHSNTNGNAANSTDDSRVIIDIACCDGPVRFHRVINKNYGHQQQNQHQENSYEISPNRNAAALNKAMTENIRDRRQTDDGDENSQQQRNHQMTQAQQQNTDMFTCLYCNHTFKSQYCYQKHARRHLNPVSLEVTGKVTNNGLKETNITSANTSGSNNNNNCRREVKLLDMNVQYYPCKTCGSKFPSYYFVHKHRKMCHAEEMTALTASGNGQTTSDSTSNHSNNDNSKLDKDVMATETVATTAPSLGGGSDNITMNNNNVDDNGGDRDMVEDSNNMRDNVSESGSSAIDVEAVNGDA